MEKHKKSQSLDNSDALLDDYFENMDLNEDLKPLYETIGNNEAKNKYNQSVSINKLRNENHKRYYDIDINKLNGLPNEFINPITDITNAYNLIDSKNLLNEDESVSKKHKQLLDDIYIKTKEFKKTVRKKLEKTVLENDAKESRFSVDYFNSLELNEEKKRKVLEQYNELIISNATPTQNIYNELKKEIVRSNYINNILSILQDKTNETNNIVDNSFEDVITPNILDNIEGISYNESIEDKIKKPKNKEELNIYNYNDEAILEIQTSIDYIIENYHKLDEESTNLLLKIHNSIINNNCNIKESIENVNFVIKNIWSKTITDIYSYNSNKDFYFICSNNQFIDEKYQTILVTNKELEKAQNYCDYQIGFICNYNDNIMYITEKEDIMNADKNKIIKLKTPLQMEEEFDNFKSCNRIALDGHNTTVTALYFIDDENKEKYIKAVELANQNSLPLIILKKDK